MAVSVLEARLEARLAGLVPAEVLADLADPGVPSLRLAVYRPEDPGSPAVLVPGVAPGLVVERGADFFREERIGELRAALEGLGVGTLVGSMVDVALAISAVNDPEQEPSRAQRAGRLLSVIETTSKVSNQLDGVMFDATRQLTATEAATLVAGKGAASVDELSGDGREKLRNRARRHIREEISVAIGWGKGEAGDLVAAANSPALVAGPLLASMMSGESPWRLARAFQRKGGPLAHEDAAAVANGLFGDDPDASVTERLDSRGQWVGGPWGHKAFYRALDREVAKINARDAEAKKEAAERARAGKDCRALIDEDGTASVTIGCTPLQAAAVADRVQRAAKAARKGGSEQTLRELRSSTGIALLLHGTVDLGELPDDPELITPEISAQLGKVLQGLPAAELNVIVPLDTLIGVDITGLTGTRPGVVGLGGPSCTCVCTCGAAHQAPSSPPEPPGTGEPCPAEPAVAGSTGQPCPAEPAVAGSTGQPCPPEPAAAGSTGQSCPPAVGTPSPGLSPEPSGADPGADQGGDPSGVGAVVGAHPLFLMPEEVRALALVPGSTLFRLLTDPESGRCVERSITAYRFDPAMRAQVIAADVFCRGPGCFKPAWACQMDHVQEHGTPGGETREANAEPLCDPIHNLKTAKLWDAVIHGNRDVTWTTLLQRIYVTKAHDYGQYTKLLTAATAGIQEAVRAGVSPEDAVNAAIYAALSHREPGESLAIDDFDDDFNGWDQVTLTHTGENGRRRYEPAPDVRQAEIDRHRAARSGDGDGDGDELATPDESDGGQDGTATSAGEDGPDGPDESGPSTPWSKYDGPPPF